MEIGRCTSKIRSVMLTMILALIMIMMFKPPVAVQASEAGIPSANTIVDGIGSNGAGGKGKIKGGILYTRTGYLCYVLQENGDTIPGMQAKAFYSPGYEELGGAQWSCHSKKGGYSANSWTAVSPWPYTPFNKNDTTNVESIKSWMKKTDDGVTENGVQFVYDNWGEDIATKFTEGEYVLVVENILHFQPCIKEGSGGTIDFAGETEKQIRASLIAYYMNNSLKRDEATKKANAKIAEMKRFNHFNELVNSVKILYESKYGTIEKGASYKSVGSPIIGTCTDCINYQHQVGADADQFKSYTNGVACMAEHIEVGGIGEDAGFIAYAGAITQSTRWSDPDVQKYGIAMIVIKATDDKSIRTYWEPNGSPGKPEPSEPLKKGKCDIVKGYYEENETTGEKTPLGVFSERDTTNKIIICSEPEFELVQWDISTTFNDGLDPTSWNPPGSISRSGTTPETVKLEVPEKVVYVLLKRVIREEEEAPPEVNYIIPQSTITRRITLSKPDYQLSMPLIHEYDFVWELKEHTECAGHKYNTPCTGNHTRADGSSYNCGTDCVGNVSYCTSYYWEDDELVFSLDNVQKEAYPDILATKSGWHFVTVLNGMVQRTVDYTRTIKDVVRTEDATTNKDWDVRCVLLRGKDKLTVASWKNTDLGTEAANTDLAGVSASGFMVADTDSGDRKLADYTEVFNVDIQNLPVDNKTTWKAALGGIVDKSGNRKEPPCHTDAGVELTNPLGIAVNVLLETYSGSPDGGRNDMSCDSSVKAYAVAGYNHHNGRETPSGGQVTFRPYVQMNYDTYVEDIKTAYVLGEYDRSMTPNDYVEIAWNETGDPNLTLSSLQWSTHVRSTQLFGSGNVLLGGAALTLGIKNPDRQEMMLRTFQCIIEGKGKEQIEKAGGSDGGLDEAQAVAAHRAYVQSVLTAIDSLNVEQWASRNVDAGHPWGSGGRAVNSGDSLSFLGSEYNGRSASTDSKYYFADADTGAKAAEGDLDVKENGTVSKKYTFFTNTYGEIRYVVDAPGLPNSGGNERQGVLADDSVSEDINRRTHVVDKLRMAVEQSTGKDRAAGGTGMRSRTGVNWYNEAFDGITVIVQTTTIGAGYADPYERQTVLDPNLTTKSTGQGEMIKQSGDAYVLSAYKAKNYTQRYGKADMVGEFKGVEVYTESLDRLFWSRNFWIANSTTQDLH